MNPDLERPRPGEGVSRRGGVVVVAAHPDDETIGAGALLHRLREGAVVHLTDGAPHDARFRPRGIGDDREAYARARRRELLAALARAGVPEHRALTLGAADLEAVFAVEDLSRALATILGALRPALVVTHPYEGGHPDHDAAAVVVRAAIALARRAGLPAPRLVEMTSYHAGRDGLETGRFLESPLARQVTRVLTPAEQEVKREMLACFTSQQAVLAAFAEAVGVERFRPAAPVDFAAPPHAGPLWYERFGFPITGARWREAARCALAALRLEERFG